MRGRDATRVPRRSGAEGTTAAQRAAWRSISALTVGQHPSASAAAALDAADGGALFVANDQVRQPPKPALSNTPSRASPAMCGSTGPAPPSLASRSVQ